MQLPTIACSDSESDDEVELYQVPDSVHLQAAVQAEASGLQAGAAAPSGEEPAPEQQMASSANQPSSTGPAVHGHDSCSQPAEHPVGCSNSQHTSSSTHHSGEALVTGLLQALGFPEPEAAPESEAAPNPAPESVPLSSTSSASHVRAANADRRSSSSSSSSSSASDIDLYSSFSTSTAAGSSTAGAAPAADSNSIPALEMDGLLADSDLDALLKRLTAARAAAGTGANTATVSMPAQHTAGGSMGRQSSSDLSSDNSSSSLVNDPQGLDSSSPPPSSTYSSYEPRWLKQQRQQQQDCAGSKSSSIAGSVGSPTRNLPCAERVWVPEPPSTVLDLRSSAATVKGASAAAAAEGGAVPCSDTNVLKLQAGNSVKSASKAAGSGMWVGDSGSESDSSEEDWQQFRQRQRGGTGVVAPAVVQQQAV